MPVLDDAKYLRQSIESILSDQTHQDLELIIVDDGSQDGSLDIIREYLKDERIKLVINPITLGITDSRNMGMSIARGKYIAVQDADDVSLPTRLERQVEYLEAHEDVAAVGTQNYVVDEDGRELVKSNHPDEVAVPRIDIVHPSLMFRRKYLLEYAEPLHDEGLILELMKLGKVVNLPEHLLKYRLRRSSKTYRRKPTLSPDLNYRYRLCRNLTWGGKFDGATKEIRTLLKENLPIVHKLNLVVCYVVAKLRSPAIAQGLAGVYMAWRRLG